MASYFPLGTLVSFGSYSFTANRSAVIAPAEELAVTYAPIVGRVYPIDRLGNGVASLANTLKVWSYLIVAQDYGATAHQELYVVEQQFNLLRDYLVTVNIDGTTNAVQTLTVASADQGTPTNRTATARLVKVDPKEWNWNAMTVELSFAIRGEFT